MTGSLPELGRQIGHAFGDPGLLEEALTHRSAGARNNERLEFLGDAVLNFIIAAELFRRYPKASEGELSRLRASLVNREALAERARALQLGEYLILGSGELKSGGYRRASILADALEAVFGAVYLDAGFEPCRARVLDLYRERLHALPEEVSELKDPKTQLQEFLQSRKRPLPSYRVIDLAGESHAQVFLVECAVEGLDTATQGRGNSRRAAEQDAARKALELLRDA